MKKVIVVLVVALLFTGCAKHKDMDNVRYEPYGLINKDEVHDDSVTYKTKMSSVIWGVILVETIIAPVYFFGFNLYEPESKK